MAMFVNGRRVITNAKGAVVRSVSENYTSTWHRGKAKFENICKSEDLVNCCEDVKVDGHAVATIKSYFPQSYGDEAGIGGGVKSGTINGKGVFITASSDVFVSSLDGSIVNEPIVREGDLVVSNSGNCDPAPIEYLPAYQINNPCKAPALEDKPDSGQDSLSIVVHGKNQPFYGHLVTHCKQSYTHLKALLATDMDAKDTQGLAKRLTFKGLKQGNYAFGCYQDTYNGKRIAISFLEDTQVTVAPKTKPCNIQDEATQVVMLRPVMQHQLPKMPLSSVDKNDFSDIFRLSNNLRARVYHVLMMHQLTPKAALFLDEDKDTIALDPIDWANSAKDMKPFSEFDKNWYELLPASLQTAVDEELSTKIISPLSDGFLYIFLNGHIWREIQIKDGNLHEIDLRRFGAFQARPMMGVEQQNVMVPYKVAGKKVVVELAFSEEQWSWSRVRFYGGLAEDDERRVDAEDPVIKNLSECEKRRQNRFTTLDLESLIDGKQTDVLDKNGVKHLFEEFGIYHCVIPAPTIPISRGINDILMLQQELICVSENILNPVHEHFGHSALLVYKYFFDEKSGLLSKQKTTDDIKKANAIRMQQRNELLMNKHFYHAARLQDDSHDDVRSIIDLDKVKATLKVDRRARLRTLIRITQQSLISLIQEKDNSIVNAQPSLLIESDVDWHNCVKDYLCSNIGAYTNGFNLIGNLANALGFEPSGIDIDFELKRDIDKNKATCGELYIASLIEKQHPLYHLLHPSKQDAEKAQSLPDINQEKSFKQNFPNYIIPETEAFNVYFFKYLAANPNDNLSKSFEFINAVSQDYLTNIAKSLHKSGKENWLNISFDIIKVYAGIADRNAMMQTELKHISKIQEDEVILGTPKSLMITKNQTKGFVNSIRKSNGLQAKYFFKQKKENSKGVERVMLTVTEKFENLNEAEVISLFDTKQKAMEFSSKSVTEQQEILGEIGRLSALNKANKLELDYHVIVGKQKDYEKTPLFSESTVRFFDKTSAGFLSVMAFLNVYTKIDAIAKQYKKEDNVDVSKGFEFGSAFISASYSLENVARSFSNMDNVRVWYQKNHAVAKFMADVEEIGFAFTPLSALATLGSAINMAISLKELWLDIVDNQPALGIAHFNKFVINSSLTFSLIGSAIKDALAEKFNKEMAKLALDESIKQLGKKAIEKMAYDNVMQGMGYTIGRQLFSRLCIALSSPYVGMFLIFYDLFNNVIIDWLKGSELKAWARSTPFSLKPSQSGFKNEGQLIAEFAHLVTHPEAYVGVENGTRSYQEHFVEFHLPAFDPDSQTIQVCIYSKKRKIMAPQITRSMPYMPAMRQPDHYEDAVYHKVTKTQTNFDEMLNVTTIRLYFDDHQFDSSYVPSEYIVYCQYRIVLENGMTLPLDMRHGEYLKNRSFELNYSEDSYHTEPLVINTKGYDKPFEYCHEDPGLIAMLKRTDCQVGHVPA